MEVGEERVGRLVAVASVQVVEDDGGVPLLRFVVEVPKERSEGDVRVAVPAPHEEERDDRPHAEVPAIALLLEKAERGDRRGVLAGLVVEPPEERHLHRP